MQKRGPIVPLSALTAVTLSLVAILGSPISPLVAATSAAMVPAAHHDIYNSARTALVNAQRQLAESLWQEQELLKSVQHVQQELNDSLALLASAEELDPSMKAPIGELRSRLTALQARSSLCPMDSSSSLERYRKLLDDLQVLIEHY